MKYYFVEPGVAHTIFELSPAFLPHRNVAVDFSGEKVMRKAEYVHEVKCFTISSGFRAYILDAQSAKFNKIHLGALTLAAVSRQVPQIHYEPWRTFRQGSEIKPIHIDSFPVEVAVGLRSSADRLIKLSEQFEDEVCRSMNVAEGKRVIENKGVLDMAEELHVATRQALSYASHFYAADQTQKHL